MNELDQHLLNDFQRDLSLSPTPYADMAKKLAISELEVITGLRTLIDNGSVSRVGPVFCPHQCGVSSLVAMAVPQSRLEQVAELINAIPSVNHNYEREHHYNLWFVVVAQTQQQLTTIIEDIENQTELDALTLPMLEAYHIDLGFTLQWN